MTYPSETAAKIRSDCPIPESSRRLDFIDFPTGWALQEAGLAHVDSRCSAMQTGGTMLCDCSAIDSRWKEWKALLALADLMEFLGKEPTERSSLLLVVAREKAMDAAEAYRGESPLEQPQEPGWTEGSL